MAIREKEEKKVGMKITDNLDGDKKADEKLLAKYEKGSNGTSAYRLWEISKALRVSMTYFFPTPMLPNFTTVTHEEILQDKNLNLSPRHWIEKKKDRSLEEPLVLTKEMEIK